MSRIEGIDSLLHENVEVALPLSLLNLKISVLLTDFIEEERMVAEKNGNFICLILGLE